jgi:tetratricopeptide (TPR) repeat protein
MAFRILSISDDVEPREIDGMRWHPLRHTLDVRGFGLNAYSAAAEGDELIEDHTEAGEGSTEGHQELYVVLRGAARFTLDGEEYVVPAGSLVFLPDPTTRRHATAAAPDSLVLAVGGQEGKAYEVSHWEDRFLARGDWAAGRREQALETLRRAAREHPRDGATFYDLACLEAMAGEHEAAIEHLGQAVALRPAVREWAAEDHDLDAIRDRPDYPA